MPGCLGLKPSENGVPPLPIWACCRLQLGEPSECLLRVAAAHLKGRLEAGATTRTLWLTEEGATVVVRQLHTFHPRRFSFRHAGDRA